MNDTLTHRPVTSKARGVCKYYTTSRGCFAGNSCKFLHTPESAVDPSGSTPAALTPFDRAKRCRYYAEGFCRRGDKCWFLHVVDKEPVTEGSSDSEDDEACSICFEKPTTYGLLGGCSHIFCIDCIRKWRDPAGKGSDTTNIKKCPMCRAACRYIIPSSRFFKDGQEEKAQSVQRYKDTMGKVPCKHFAASKEKHPTKPPLCPFGNECFYQHLNEDGTPHVFSSGISASMRTWKRRMGGHTRPGEIFDGTSPFLDFLPPEGSEEEIQAINMAGSIAMNMFDQMVHEMLETNRSAGRGRGRGGRGRARSRRAVNLNEARIEMVAGAVSAIRAQLQRIETSRNSDTVRPVVVPGTLAPASDWDLAADGEGFDGGWGWNDLTPEANPAGNVDLMGRLELLVRPANILSESSFIQCNWQADHMLGTLARGGHDDESPPPPLEPIERGDTLPPPLEPTETTEAPPPPLIPIETSQDDEDELPALESVSNSSDEGVDSDEDSDDDPSEHVSRAERVFDFAFNFLRGTPHTRFPPHTSTQPPFAAGASSRFSTTVVGRGQTTVDEEDSDSESSNEANDESEEEEHHDVGVNAAHEEPAQSVPAAEPPFVTDGRGRVVWSNKNAVEATPGASSEPSASEETSTGSRSLFGRMLDAFF
ncbi:hypothetical protein DXG03_001568 [Asterophora parasitica]|uniref:RING-type E3 ubiquitin transferase n=1 Tax=Asterophora parasitica TaxID=117018 RepID=A0A9P7G3C5_9AGAR|nr:hypothetical protein DXG03_001568 [Asterophora parasitica]